MAIITMIISYYTPIYNIFINLWCKFLVDKN